MRLFLSPTPYRLLNASLNGLAIFMLIFMIRCANNPAGPGSGVLEEVKDESPVASMSSAPNNPKLTRLNELLQSYGYEALGLQFEPDSVLDLLYTVFSNVKTQNRQLKLVYTGLLMSYDARHRSITIGGTKDPLAVISYIEKHIPIRTAAEKTALPPPVWLSPSPVPTPYAGQPSPSPVPKASSSPTPFNKHQSNYPSKYSATPLPTVTPSPTDTPSPTPLYTPSPSPSPSILPEDSPKPTSPEAPMQQQNAPESERPGAPGEEPSAAPLTNPESDKTNPPPLIDTPEANPQDTEL